MRCDCLLLYSNIVTHSITLNHSLSLKINHLHHPYRWSTMVCPVPELKLAVAVWPRVCVVLGVVNCQTQQLHNRTLLTAQPLISNPGPCPLYPTLLTYTLHHPCRWSTTVCPRRLLVASSDCWRCLGQPQTHRLRDDCSTTMQT